MNKTIERLPEPALDAVEEAAKTLANTLMVGGWARCNEQTRNAHRADARALIKAATPALLKQIADRVEEANLMPIELMGDDPNQNLALHEEIRDRATSAVWALNV